MVKIKLDQLKIDSISHTSGVFSGFNMPVKWRHIEKRTEGFGTISGENNHFKDNEMTVKNSKDVN